MKSFFFRFIPIVLALFCTSAKADIVKPGTIALSASDAELAGGASSATRFRGDTGQFIDTSTSSGFGVEIAAYYFLLDNFSLGLEGQYGSSTSINSGFRQDSIEYGGGPSMLFLFSMTEYWSLMTTVSYNITRGQYRLAEVDGLLNQYTSKGGRVRVFIGAAFFLNDAVSLNAGFHFTQRDGQLSFPVSGAELSSTTSSNGYQLSLMTLF